MDGVPETLAGRYRVGDELGRGGAAVVHRAWDTRLERPVAVKLLRRVLLDPAARERFEQEAHLLARLDHPGLVAVYDAALFEDHPYLVLELIEGEPLSRQRLPVAEVVRIGSEIAEALAYVHARGVTHRDVKPGNILVGADGRVRLADFGIARSAADDHHPTVTGTVIGTPAYLAPEQVRGQPATGAADVYALGLVLMELLRGTPVYQGPPEIAALARLTAPPVVDPVWPAAVRQTLAAMTADAPEQRPRADEVSDRLRSGTTGTTLPIAAPAWGRVRPGRRAGAAIGAAIAAAVLVPAVVLGGHLLSDAPKNPSTGAAPAAALPTSTPTTSPTPTATVTGAAGATTITTVTRKIAAPGPADPRKAKADPGKGKGNSGKGKGNNGKSKGKGGGPGPG